MNTNGDYDQNANAAGNNGHSPDAQLTESQVADARLTAYVLDELDAVERAAVEKELADSETARKQVMQISRSVGIVTAALATEPTAELPTDNRLRLLERSAAQAPGRIGAAHPAQPVRRVLSKYALAASLLLCLTAGLAWLLLPGVQAAREAGRRPVAMNHLHELNDGENGVVKKASKPPSFTLGDPYGETSILPAKSATRDARFDQQRRPRGSLQVDLYNASGSMAKGNDQQAALKGYVGEIDAEKGGRDLESILNIETYDRIYENPFLDVRQNPLSTFSIDVDTASYANVRRFLNSGSLPPKDAVRIEELVNYFTYHYAPPTDDKPFAVHAEVAGCPWEAKHRLLRIAIKGREIDMENRPASNLVFLIDVSGSMDDPAKLPLLKSALHLLIDKLGENDRVAMVVYAGSSGLVLPSTSGLYKETILAALDQLQAGGSTNGGSGIQLAYQVAREKLIRGGTNRVILCTDGDFNVGVTDQGSLTRLIEDEAKSGVFLSVLGFGSGNLKDSTMEKLADRGNGNYAYIDTLNEARKVLVEQLGGTLVTIAKDVKLQLEFNPLQVAAYRLIGYENRLLRAEDFNDDKKDAGEIGAGHTVTALYELVPAGDEAPMSQVDELKYQRTSESTAAAGSDELLTLKLRYKDPEGDKSRLIESVVKDTGEVYARASEDFRFASAVAGFGLMLRESQYKGDLTLGAVLELAEASRGTDENGHRAEFVELVNTARGILGK